MRAIPRHLAALALPTLLASTLIVGTSHAGLLLISNNSAVMATASASNATDSKSAFAGGGPVSWMETVTAEAYEDDTQSDVAAFMNTSWAPDFIVGAGAASGSGSGGLPWTVQGTSIMDMVFVCAQCQVYSFTNDLSTGTGPPYPNVKLQDASGHSVEEASVGHSSVIGRLAPGTYRLFGTTQFPPIQADVVAGLLSTNLSVYDCPASLIGDEPSDLIIFIGQPVILRFTPTPSPQLSAQGTPAIQWQKDHQNLTDGGRISGATTPTLTITQAMASDTGWYHAVVTDGAIVQPTRLARVSLNPISDVADPLVSTRPRLMLEALSPNPFAGGTRVRFAMPRSGDARVDVYDVTGRHVRTLLSEAMLSAGLHTLLWDGRNDSGVRAEVGTYLVRVRSGPESDTRRVVMISNDE